MFFTSYMYYLDCDPATQLKIQEELTLFKKENSDKWSNIDGIIGSCISLNSDETKLCIRFKTNRENVVLPEHIQKLFSVHGVTYDMKLQGGSWTPLSKEKTSVDKKVSECLNKTKKTEFSITKK